RCPCWFAHFVRCGTFASLTLARSLRLLWYGLRPFVRSLRLLLLRRSMWAPYESARRARTKGRSPYKSERSERATANEGSVPKRKARRACGTGAGVTSRARGAAVGAPVTGGWTGGRKIVWRRGRAWAVGFEG